MFVFLSNPRPRVFPSVLLVLAAALATAAITAPVLAQGTRLWTQSRIEEFEKGTPKGVALTSDGHLLQGPATTEILTTPSTFVWSVAVDAQGTAYVGTASPASVLRIGKDAKPFTLFETADLSAQVVRLGPDGSLYVATLPSGKVYRLHPDATAKQDESTATLLFDAAKLNAPKSAPPEKTAAKPSDASEKSETKSHYIWDLTFDPKGRLYIATGGPAAIYRVDPAQPNAQPEEFFKSDEEHIRSLAWDSKGNLIAGSDGSGLVYRISPDGKGYVLFQAPRREITSVAVAANGTIYAASVGDKSHNPLPPLPLQGNATITITVVQPGSLQAANNSTALPEGTEIYALTEGQAPRKLWSGKDEIVYALAAGPVGLLGAMALVNAGFETTVYSRSPKPNPNAAVAEATGARYISSQQTSIEEMVEQVGNIDLIYEAAGAPQFAFEVLKYLGANGIYVFTGVPRGETPVEFDTEPIMYNLVLKNQVVLGVVNAGPQAFDNAVRDIGVFAARWPRALGAMITGRYPMEAFHDPVMGTAGGIKNVICISQTGSQAGRP